ncbi:hypothetical protein R3P38DRAFT_3357259, partial [Favolaschia claudopus]
DGPCRRRCPPFRNGSFVCSCYHQSRHSSIRPATAPPPFLQLPLAFHTTAPATATHRPSNTSRLYAASLSGLSSPSVPPQISLLPPVPNQRWLVPALPASRSDAGLIAALISLQPLIAPDIRIFRCSVLVDI